MIQDILFLIVVFLANIVQSVTGFAGTLLAMPFSIHLIGVSDAKAVLNMLPVVGCIAIVIKDCAYIRWKELSKICIFMLIGMIVGDRLFNLFSLNILLTCYGILIIVIAGLRLFGVSISAPGKIVQCVILFAAGLIHGMFVSGGALLVIYASYAFSDKTEFRATLSAVWILLNSILCVGHVMSKAFSTHALVLLLACVLPVLLAVKIGNSMHHKINQRAFETATNVLLLISGISAIL